MQDPPIKIITTAAAAMRFPEYADGGDWYMDGDTLVIQISDQVPETQRFLFALHELVEWKLCQVEGVPQAAVDAFDTAFRGDTEPGDDPAAPYRTQHRRAMLIEHMMAQFMGIIGYGVVE